MGPRLFGTNILCFLLTLTQTLNKSKSTELASKRSVQKTFGYEIGGAEMVAPKRRDPRGDRPTALVNTLKCSSEIKHSYEKSL